VHEGFVSHWRRTRQLHRSLNDVMLKPHAQPGEATDAGSQRD
jgi:hypothetical protein